MLIPCPKCGKPISNQAEQCIHCKTTFGKKAETTDTPSTTKTFCPSLSKLQREKIFVDFAHDDPVCAYSISKYRKLLKFVDIYTTITSILSLILLAVFIYFVNVKGFEVLLLTPSILALAFCFLYWVVEIVLAICKRVKESSMVAAYKKMYDWTVKNNYVHFLQTLNLHKDLTPRVFNKLVDIVDLTAEGENHAI